MCVYLKYCFGNCTGVSFIDSSKIQVCHKPRISRNKVFQDLAARGKTSVNWFFGFKLHVVVNELGEMISMKLTPGNVDKRKPLVEILEQLWRKVFGNRGYVSQKLATKLLDDCGVKLLAKPKRNMKKKLMRLHEKLLSGKRSIIENVNDQLKKASQIEYSRHRSPVNFCANVLCGLIAPEPEGSQTRKAKSSFRIAFSSICLILTQIKMIKCRGEKTPSIIKIIYFTNYGT